MRSHTQLDESRSVEPVTHGPEAESLDATETTIAASRALLGVVARSLAEALELVTLPQFRVMVILSGGPLRMGALAERAHYLPSTFTRSVDRMVASGWVERTGNPGSRREVMVSLTPHGSQLVAHVTERRRREIAEVLDRLAAGDRQQVASAFALFAEAFGEPAAEDLLPLGL
ncbi:MAG: MarR family transcriptional regulator [Rhodoglobus sp.]